jgi:tripartite-type tricarboxylate transporter receptor subunit TctC
MFKPHSIASMFAVGMVVLGAHMTLSQNYPNKPIRIVTAEAGGGGDFVARLVGQKLAASLGQPVISRQSGRQCDYSRGA